MGGYGGEPGAHTGEPGVPERAQVPADAPARVRLEACVEVLRQHNPRPLISASPGSPYYEAGLTARCVCGWSGTTQVASGLSTEAQRGLAEAECDRHLAEKILERLG